ncbi:MAG TPA: hypothetical protein DDW23_04220 [Planctomycetes bacterium]|nr:hypothetical protein [Planctomycetota bacterium]
MFSCCRREATALKRGFSLIEVLLAMAIFVLAVTALMGMFQFGGGMEATARAYAELAPSVENLAETIVHDAWLPAPDGTILELRTYKGEPVPDAPGYLYDLDVAPPGEDPSLYWATLRIYRSTPERPAAKLSFLLPRRVPVARRLEQSIP